MTSIDEGLLVQEKSLAATSDLSGDEGDEYVVGTISTNEIDQNNSLETTTDNELIDPIVYQNSQPVNVPLNPKPVQKPQNPTPVKRAFNLGTFAKGVFTKLKPVLTKITDKISNKLEVLIKKMRDRSSQHKEKLRRCFGLFEKFKTVYRKKFRDDYTEARGLEHFERNNDLCDENNSKNDKPYQLGLNEWSYLSFEEFSDKFLMKNGDQFKDNNYLSEKLRENPSRVSFFKANRPNVGSSQWGVGRLLQTRTFNVENYARSLNIPTKKSFRDYVTPVKNQRRCNSCYAFAAVGSLEILLNIKNGRSSILSEQEILDCSSWDLGCEGGDPANTILYYSYYGLAYDSQYPYLAVKGNCKYFDSSRKVQGGAYSTYLGGDVDSLLVALSQGPVSVIHEVNREFSLYKTGVYTETACGTSLNHSAVAYEYDLEAPIPYIGVKNGWGTTWGDLGHYKLALGPLDGRYTRGTCGLFSHSYNSQAITY